MDVRASWDEAIAKLKQERLTLETEHPEAATPRLTEPPAAPPGVDRLAG